MGSFLAFFLGWAVGSKAGPGGFDDVVVAAKAVRDSEEFSALLAVSRTHLSDTLRALSKLASGETPMPETGDLLAQVQRLTARRPT